MKNKIILIVVTIILIVALVLTVKILPKSSKQVEVKIINEIEEYGYVLEDNETVLHQGYFEQLVDVLGAENIVEEDYAKLIVKLFISDFYNLDNKITKNDVGGIQYIHKTARDNMILKAKDTIYKYVENNIDSTRLQQLPIVSDIEIVDIDKKEFEYGNKTDEDAYEVSVKWNYKVDLGYQDEAVIKLVHENKKLSIVSLE